MHPNRIFHLGPECKLVTAPKDVSQQVGVLQGKNADTAQQIRQVGQLTQAACSLQLLVLHVSGCCNTGNSHA